MIAFAALLERLARAPHAAAQQAWLAHYRARVPEAVAGRAVALLEGRVVLPRLGTGGLRALVATRCDAAQFALCRAAGGELAETLALLWPAGRFDPPSLEDVLAGGGDWGALLPGWMDRSDVAVRLALLRLATGRLPRLASPPAAARHRAEVMLTYLAREAAGLKLGFSLRGGDAWLGAGRAEAAPAVAQTVAAWAQAHATARFGPVCEVEPGLVLVVEYSRAEPSRRYRAGLVLRDARAVGVGERAAEVAEIPAD